MCGVRGDVSLVQVPADIALQFRDAIRDNHYPRPMTIDTPLMTELPKFVPQDICTDEMLELIVNTTATVFPNRSREHREAHSVLRDAFPEYMDLWSTNMGGRS